jgi:hypothetical protein
VICHRKEEVKPSDIIIIIFIISNVNSGKSSKLIINVACSYVYMWCGPVISGLCIFAFYNGIYPQFSASPFKAAPL